MKKKIALIMTVCMLSVIPTGCGSNATESDNEDKKVSSEQTFEANPETDFTWYENEESDSLIPKGGIVISGYVGTDTDVVIPESIDGKAVVAIDECAFSPYTKDEIEGSGEEFDFWEDIVGLEESNDEQIDEYLNNHEQVSKITSIYIPSSVKGIGEYAFFFCDSLKEITVYENEETQILVDDAGFAYCTSLICLNGDFKPFSNNIYEGCTALEEVKLYPKEYDDVQKVSWYSVMENFSSLKKIVIADGTESLQDGIRVYNHMDGVNVFEGKSLCVNEIYIPASVKQIDIGLFINEDRREVTEMSASKYEELGTDDYSLEDLDVTFNQNITIITPIGSYAEEFAKEHGIPYKNE